MSNESIEIACPHCLAVNRVPAARLTQQPQCGRCGKPLFDTHPAALTDANYSTLVGRTQLPVVVDCWAAWCGPCRNFAPVFEQAAAQFEPRARFAKLDTEANQATAAMLGIRSIPTLIVFRGGRELTRMSGAMSLPQFGQWLHQQGVLA
ncbi:MAG: thioredoxin TrxC [Metallibacterium scheffleri]|jgi:thioredoxin 2|uniref:thioredoxin TrxC n=1 Tax=Metallibacterium scheffleri TaxID=993689 RepID=UPI0026EC15E8|nr:thioredoxin TrxC [Metallibacterium scheffleri]MCK9366873.1 thioredoxin TrxC [Metallibacterium scheffleri]